MELNGDFEMTDQYAELRAALDAGPTPGPWFTSSGLGFAVATVAKIRVAADACPTAYAKADADYIAAAHPEAIRALLAERDQYARVLNGLPQDAIDGGWTAKGISAYAKALEAERDALRGHLAELIAICEPNLYPCPDKPNSKWGKLQAAKAALTQQEQGK